MAKGSSGENMKTGFSHLFFLLIGFFLAVMLAGCNTQEIQSGWRDREIVIDGNGEEWNNALASYFDESRVLLGVANDSSHLYLRLSTSDRGLQRQLLHGGCTVWFDAKGGENKALGLNFPFGGQMMPPPRLGERGPGPGSEPLQPVMRDGQLAGMLQEAQQFVEILRPGSAQESRVITLTEVNLMDIELAMSASKNLLVYELKIPLVSNDDDYPFVVAPKGKKTIGVGFAAAEEADHDMPPGKGPGGFGGHGGGGPGGNFPGGGGGMPPPGGKKHRSFELWTKVTLASPAVVMR
jgi:hypothetical protein